MAKLKRLVSYPNDTVLVTIAHFAKRERGALYIGTSCVQASKPHLSLGADGLNQFQAQSDLNFVTFFYLVVDATSTKARI